MEIYYVLRYLLAIIFLVSGLPKIIRIRNFAEAIREYNILPKYLVLPFAYLSSWIELLAAMALAFGYYVIWAELVLVPLLISYGIAIGINLYRKADLNCHCFEGLGESKLTFATLMRAMFLLGANLFVFANDFGIFGTSYKTISILNLVVYAGLVLVLLLLIELTQRGLIIAEKVKKEYGF
ncbi:MauE/DoxX family redox-associated membrane protein [Effusibacillus consociatus]|uniref:MauE/DoxX family redox-associated membrane protein n=1 Tax=Effusibacillus consociatus TaxID=1117041 RepID=UPI0036D27FDA